MGNSRRFRPSPAMVVASIALFVAVGGVSWAAATIDTNDIKNGAVTKKKIAKKAVAKKKIKNEAVTTKKIADQAVTTDKIADSAVNGAKVEDDSLTGSDIDESTLGTVPSADNANQLGGVAANGYARRIFARVSYNDASPSIIAASPGVSTNGESALGFPRVIFPQSVDACSVIGSASSNVGTQIVRRSTNFTGTQVQFAIKNENGAAVRSNFDLIVVC
jgi:hypothetical protein